jgi:hypothetical protein
VSEQDIVTLILAAIVGLDKIVVSITAAVAQYEATKAAKQAAAAPGTGGSERA